jgi:hypothetical protein
MTVAPRRSAPTQSLPSVIDHAADADRDEISGGASFSVKSG